jgi:serralysin
VGDDRLDGGAGRDLLGGGSGHDRLTGGDGADRFVFQAGFGKDVILDFQAGVDVLDLSAVDAAGWSPAVSQVGSDTLMLFEDGSSLTLIGVQASDLGGQDGLWT